MMTTTTADQTTATATTTTTTTKLLTNSLPSIFDQNRQTFVTLDPLKLSTTTVAGEHNYLFDNFKYYFSNIFLMGETLLWPLFAIIYGGSLLAFIIGRSILFSRASRRQREFCEKLRKKRLEQRLKEETEEADRLIREVDEMDPEPEDEFEKFVWWKRRLGRPMKHHPRLAKRNFMPTWPYLKGYQVPYRWDQFNDEGDDDDVPLVTLQATEDMAPREPPVPAPPPPPPAIVEQVKEEPKLPPAMIFKPLNMIEDVEEPSKKPPSPETREPSPAPPPPPPPPPEPEPEDDSEDDEDALFMMELGVTSKVDVSPERAPSPRRVPSPGAVLPEDDGEGEDKKKKKSARKSTKLRGKPIPLSDDDDD